MIIHSKHVYTSQGVKDVNLIIEGKKIKGIIPSDGKADKDYGELRIIPGIIDTHNHGTLGYSMANADPDFPKQIKGYVKGLASQGVTGILATCGEPSLYPALVNAIKEDYLGAKIIGIHSEGPYLNRVGEKAVDLGHPDIDLHYLENMVNQGQGHLKLVGIAPELPKAKEAITYLLSQGVKVAFTHSDCNYDQAIEAFKWGISVTTHTANVMSGIHHRQMGGLGACLLDQNVNNEIICDLLHVNKEMLEIMFKCKPYSKFLMVSDNVPLAGGPQGTYTLELDPGEKLICTIDAQGYCLTETGRLFGSTKPVMFGIKNLVTKLNIPLEKVLEMSSLNPARLYGYGDSKGSIEANKDADLVIIDDNYEVLQTYREGRIVYDHKIDTDLFNPEFLKQAHFIPAK